MKNEVASLRELLRSSISESPSQAYMGAASRREFYRLEVTPYRSISNPKNGKQEQTHLAAAVRLGSTVEAFC